MSDVKPEPKEEVIEDAVVVEETTPAETAVVEVAAPVATPHQVVYVQTPPEPRKKGNRAAGAAIAVASGIIFAAVLATVTAIIGLANSGKLSFAFVTDVQFYIPTLFFIIGFVLLVLLANRANWWAYIFGSIIVAVVVYFGTIGLGLLSTGIILDTPEEAAARYLAQLTNPFIVVSALLAREVSLWAGSLIARRGRKVKVRNSEARGAWEREVAEKRAAHEQGSSPASAVG